MAKSGARRRGSNAAFDALRAKQIRAREQRRNVPSATSLPAAQTAIAVMTEPDETEAERLTDKYGFYLVQRLESRKDPRDDGAVTRFFSPEMMGSSEYEWGAMSYTFKRIQEAGSPVIVPAQMTRHGITRTVYFVGPVADIEDKIAACRIWFSADYLRCKETSRFDVVFLGDDNPSSWDLESWHAGYIKTDAWWSFDSDILWTLDPNLAQKILTGLETKLS